MVSGLLVRILEGRVGVRGEGEGVGLGEGRGRVG